MNKNIGPYKLIKECGRGTYGRVYIAENSITSQRVALKILQQNIETRELKALIKYRNIHHKNLLRVNHVDRTPDNELFYTMDLADNLGDAHNYIPDTLANRLDKFKTIETNELKRITKGVIDGISALHAADLVHRDIKPANILFVNGEVILADIGLMTDTHTAEQIGTLAFMNRDISCNKKQDLYALGLVIYCSITGYLPSQYPKLPKSLDKSASWAISSSKQLCSGHTTLNSFDIEKNYYNYKKLTIVSGILLILISLISFAIYYFLIKSDEAVEIREIVSVEAPVAKEVKKPIFTKVKSKFSKPIKVSEDIKEEKIVDDEISEAVKYISEPITFDEYVALSEKMRSQLPPISEDLKLQAKEIYEKANEEYEKVHSKYWHKDDMESLKKLAYAKEKLKKLDDTNLLYQLHCSVRRFNFFLDSGLRDPSRNSLYVSYIILGEINKIYKKIEEY